MRFFGWAAVLAAISCGGGGHPPIADYGQPRPGSGGDTGTEPGSAEGGSPGGGTLVIDWQAQEDDALQGVPPCVADLPNGFCFVSSAGDSIGLGKPLNVSTDAEFFPTLEYGSVVAVNVKSGSAKGQWIFGAASPLNFVLAPGPWTDVLRYPESDAAHASFHVSGAYRSCNAVTGGFYFSEFTRTPFGGVESLAATFVQHCEGVGDALLGAIHFNATGTAQAIPDEMDCEASEPVSYCQIAPPAHPRGGYGRITLAEADFSVAFFRDPDLVNSTEFQARINTPGLGTPDFSAGFGAALGDALGVGSYNVDSKDPTGPQLLADCAGAGRLLGSFEVAEYLRAGDVLEKALIHFRYACGGGPELVGHFRYNVP